MKFQHIFNPKRTTYLLGTSAISLIASLWLHTESAVAQDQASDNINLLEEIVITARRREESLYEIPLALSALSEQDFKDQNLDNLFDVGKTVPNLFIGNFGNGNPNHISVFLRGVGQQDHIITVDSAVGLYIDGVYLGRQVGANLSLSNIAQVEVARGPQGTLYGRNSIGGAINYITKKPSDGETAELAVQVGELGRARVDFYGATQLSDTVSGSIAALYNSRDGIGNFINQNTSREVGEIQEASIRGALEFNPSDNFSLLLTADYTDTEYGQQPVSFNAGANGELPNGLPAALFAVPSPDDSASPATNVNTQTAEAYGIAATATWKLSDSQDLKLIASHRSSEYAGGADNQDSIGAVVFPEIGEADQTSVELQLSGDGDSYNYVAGLYYFTEDGFTESSPFEIFPDSFTDSGELLIIQDTTSYAAFGSIDFVLSDRLTLGLGLRATKDEKDASGGVAFFAPAILVDRNESWTAVTGDISLAYDLSDDLNGYASITRGYQSGGFPARPFGGPQEFVDFDPQYALNYELGLKGVIGDTLSVAAALFYTDYTDLQLQANDASDIVGGGFVTITENSGEAESKGIELEATWQPTGNFSIQTSIGVLDSEFTQVGVNVTGTSAGNTPQLSPDLTFLIAPEFSLPLDNGASVNFRISYNYRDEMFGEATNVDVSRIDSRSLVDLNIRYQPADDSWNVALYGKNVGDEVYDITSGTFGNPYATTVRNNDRREFGLRFEKNW